LRIFLEKLGICGVVEVPRTGGMRSGQHSIRINQQWRICFTCEQRDAHQVEIVDYH